MLSDGKMTKIMVVEDEEDLRDMIVLLFTREGYDTIAVSNGEEFLNQVESIKPDLVTLDVMMPGLTTSEILKELQNKTTKAKIILLTAVHYSDDEIQQLTQYGNVVEYISKPFNIHDLITRVKNHLSETPAQ
jgi:DNA-binding response OmpR family regulator